MTPISPEEINEKVATRLGLIKLSEPKVITLSTNDPKVYMSITVKWTDNKGNGRELPDYSRSIEAAWEIVEHLQKQSFAVGVFLWDIYFACEIGPHENPIATASADTAPRAICEAFLRLKQDEEKP